MKVATGGSIAVRTGQVGDHDQLLYIAIAAGIDRRDVEARAVKDLVRVLLAEGVAEAEISRRTGLARSTVRRWNGKG